MFFKTAAAACSLAALLVIGCNTDDSDIEDHDIEDRDTIVTPDDDYSPDTPPVTPDPGTTTGDDLEPTTPLEFPEDPEPAPETELPEVDEPDADEPVVEEVESDSLPDENDEQ